MNDDPTVSVIIPTWNRATTIVAAVESALDQTLPPLEVLVCDDGSSDETRQRIERIADPRVRWIAGPRGGRPAIPRNRGIAAAKGEWLAFLDSDDTWLPDKLTSQLAILRASGRRACSTNAFRVIPGAGRAGTVAEGNGAVLDLARLLIDNRVICSSAVIHKSLVTETGGFPEDERMRAIEDYCLWLRVACFTDFDYLATPQVLYTDDPKNSVRVFDGRRGRQRLEALNNFVEWCERHPTDATRPAARAARRQLRRERLAWIAGPLLPFAVRALGAVRRRLY